MKKYHLFLIIIFTIVWVWGAIDPIMREDWLLENILVLIFVPLVILIGRHFKFSYTSYTLITLFLILHIIGAHYTYVRVPFGDTVAHLLGENRNAYDRLVHFSFGLMIAYPAREIFVRVSKIKGFWSYFFPVDVILSVSAAYEVFEWFIAAKVSQVSSIAFLGTQGDQWDTQKDMFLAGAGAICIMLIIFSINKFVLKREIIFERNA
ncbi:MAG: hypothetical protein K0S38_23 [Candidatus Paceibacter sp.]|jgi:putative membrane protein|nr:hypothetical protein [Candidatus Paceibacter sp.]